MWSVENQGDIWQDRWSARVIWVLDGTRTWRCVHVCARRFAVQEANIHRVTRTDNIVVADSDSQKNLKTFHTRGTRHKSSRYLSRVNSIMLQPGVRYHAFAWGITHSHVSLHTILLRRYLCTAVLLWGAVTLESACYFQIPFKLYFDSFNPR